MAGDDDQSVDESTDMRRDRKEIWIRRYVLPSRKIRRCEVEMELVKRIDGLDRNKQETQILL